MRLCLILLLGGMILLGGIASAEPKPEERAIVIVYSRTGNSLKMAEEIQRFYDCPLIQLQAPEYEGFWGQKKASDHAWDRLPAKEVTPLKVDLTPYDLIFLGSPIWWYRPAVPLWNFVHANDFKGKKVVLFNSFNSRFRSEEMIQFFDLIAAKGGQMLGHIYVRRGRWYWQKSSEEMMEEFVTKLKEWEAGR